MFARVVILLIVGLFFYQRLYNGVVDFNIFL